MAFRFANFAHEKEEENLDSLKNICVYSTSKKQRYRPSKKEGLLVKGLNGSIVDRRTKINYCSEQFAYLSYRSQSQFTSMMPDGIKTVGSSISVILRGEQFALTCAHVVGDWSVRRDCFVNFSGMRMYTARQGEKTWKECITLDEKAFVHPNYNGQPDSGFDIALCRQMKFVSKNKNTTRYVKSFQEDVDWAAADPIYLKKGMAIEIAGYPGDGEGHPFTHTGVITDVTKRPLGGYVLWYNVDSSDGNSGSGIMITDEEWIKEYNNRMKTDVKKVTIGVHTGHHSLERLNFGTLITPSLLKWIDSNWESGRRCLSR